MAKVIIFVNQTNNVSICYPTGELSVEEVQAKDTPEGSIIVEHDDLPNEDKDFFNAWVLNDGVVSVDLNDAKVLAKSRLRTAREPLLTAQDVAFQRALETGADTTAIVAEKQRLRDITNLVDQATTLNEIRAVRISQ
jgi:hypothetical protein